MGRKQYREKKEEIAGNVGKLKSRGSNLHLHRGGIRDIEDEEFYGFFGDFGKQMGKTHDDLQKEVGINGFDILIPAYGGNT